MMEHLKEFIEILEHPPIFETIQDQQTCEEILNEEFINNEESYNELANVTYAYWIVSTKAADELPANARKLSALKEIRRHYIGEGRNKSNTISAIQMASLYRKQYRMDILRSCFYDEDYSSSSSSDSDLAAQYKNLVVQDLQRQPMVVLQCVDKFSRAIVYKPPRSSNPSASDHAFIITQLYTAERAIATTEFHSAGKVEKLSLIFNFENYSSRNSPSSSTVITLVKVLQTCYPERLGVLCVLSPPFWMRAFFNLVWPFLSKTTTEKIKLSREAISELVGEDGNEELEKMILVDSSSSTSVEGKMGCPVVDITEYTQQPFYFLSSR
jgi:hypothetical protein